ncbi:fibrobacter succinogenes major paralogous domain-containing protein [Candidatus Sulfidibacterium hydrothermale]|uniref:fibrobacter succinogenes major paralogous domain-containing protein n=1 Tax=Candidatus Sulfidibacterium hydrothermale TaxID=2875962 RepID=UPI001F0A46AA|nr:fibrobacter succinogenes major paralogous domain-containing protein [Candidatus Sulfidibacterium hydrothermale]UBM62644.1 fibrobacter succinogenes major paralogous domain-containing protein [Candidatus Sulfidibacterium hydrothermale]
MKTKAKTLLLAVSFTALAAFTGCQKDSSTPTPAPVPATVKMDSINNLQMTSVTVNFTVTPNDSQISEAGVAYSTGTTSSSATKVKADAKSGIISLTLTGLQANTKYHVWAYCTTADGTIFSKSLEIWTYGLMDIDGNGYHTVEINNRIWTVENLKVTHYRNGDPIPEVQDSTVWLNDKQGAMCWYQNNRAKYDSIYGALYNFYAVDDPRGLAPQGWHVPTLQEYIDLSIALGKTPVAGGKMKETSFKHWNAPNTGATNSTGFTALPGGMRGLTNEHKTLISFAGIKEFAYFWTSDKAPLLNCAYTTRMDYNNTWLNLGLAVDNTSAFSVRLVKDK